MTLHSLFATPVHEGDLADPALVAALAHSARSLAADDAAGRRWCRDHHYPGYTSYGSLNDLPRRDPDIATLVRRLDAEVARFAVAAQFELSAG